MEGDATEDILTYLSTGEVLSTVLVVRTWYGKAKEMQNNMERHEQMSKVRIHKCINELQETKAASGYYKAIVLANKTYKAETPVRMIEEIRTYSCCDTEDLRGRSGTVVKCCRHGSLARTIHYVGLCCLC